MALVQHWKLQDNAGNTTVVATVGNDGVMNGGNTSAKSAADGPGVAFPRSLLLDGTDDFVDISGASISFASGTAFTICCWLKPTSLATSGPVFGKSSDLTARAMIAAAGSNTAVRFGTTTDKNFTGTGWATGSWQHFLISRDASNNVRVFRGGVASSANPIAVAEAMAPNRIGQTSTSEFFGNVADFRVYNSDESANVAAIMAEASAGGGGARRRRVLVGGRA